MRKATVKANYIICGCGYYKSFGRQNHDSLSECPKCGEDWIRLHEKLLNNIDDMISQQAPLVLS